MIERRIHLLDLSRTHPIRLVNDGMEERIPSYKPSTYYYRKAFREARSIIERQDIFDALCRRDEMLREWCRERGLIPPKFEILEEEWADKPWIRVADDDRQFTLSLLPELPR